MSCFSALPSQLLTFLLVPHEIIFLQHSVYIEYAKIAVSQDFIHTLPTVIIMLALSVMFWNNPPSVDATKFTFYNKILQVSTSWLFISAFIWLWLVLQQIVYCTMWIYWSQESEYREITLPWWQRVWYSYFPAPLNPPVLSSSFLSWIICMFFASTSLVCAIAINRIKTHINIFLSHILEHICNTRYLNWIPTLLCKMIGESEESVEQGDKSEWSSLSDFPSSEVGNGDMPNGQKLFYRIPPGTSRGRKSTKSPEFVKAYETFSICSSTRTSATNVDMTKNERGDEQNNFNPMQLRHPRSST